MINIIENTANNTIAVRTPYNRPLVNWMHSHSGQWDKANRQWIVPAATRTDLLAALADFFGWAPEGTPRLTIRVSARVVGEEDGVADFAGFELARRSGRDRAVRIASGVRVVAGGDFPASGGSAKNPQICAPAGTVYRAAVPAAVVEKATQMGLVFEQADDAGNWQWVNLNCADVAPREIDGVMCVPLGRLADWATADRMRNALNYGVGAEDSRIRGDRTLSDAERHAAIDALKAYRWADLAQWDWDASAAAWLGTIAARINGRVWWGRRWSKDNAAGENCRWLVRDGILWATADSPHFDRADEQMYAFTDGHTAAHTGAILYRAAEVLLPALRTVEGGDNGDNGDNGDDQPTDTPDTTPTTEPQATAEVPALVELGHVPALLRGTQSGPKAAQAVAAEMGVDVADDTISWPNTVKAWARRVRARLMYAHPDWRIDSTGHIWAPEDADLADLQAEVTDLAHRTIASAIKHYQPAAAKLGRAVTQAANGTRRKGKMGQREATRFAQLGHGLRAAVTLTVGDSPTAIITLAQVRGDDPTTICTITIPLAQSPEAVVAGWMADRRLQLALAA